jgi:gliding motility-associated-like protein
MKKSKAFGMLAVKCTALFLTLTPLVVFSQPAGLPWPPDPVCQSIITSGIAAVTCGVTTNIQPADRFTFGMMNIAGALPPADRLNVTPDVEMYHHPSWHVDSIGNVFGITMDRCGNTYICASSNYSSGYFIEPGIVRYGNIGGGAESIQAAGTVYKIDGMTGQASVFAVLPQQAYAFQQINCEGSPNNGDRNTGPALGNIVFSPNTRQFYVSNFEDGRIYRLNENGIILDSFDPLAYDGGSPGPPPMKDLPYGLDVSPDGARLFFGTSTDGLTPNVFASLYSLGLNTDGSFVGAVNNTSLPPGANWDNFTGGETLHFSFMDLELSQFSISDLEFTPSGKLLAGIRIGCGTLHSSYNHGGRAILLSQDATGLFSVLDGTIHTGYESSIGGSLESYGGVSVYQSPAVPTYQFAISSADILDEEGPHGICLVPEGVFGAMFGPAEPAGAISYVPEPMMFTDTKGVGGDVKVFAGCECDTTCFTGAVAEFTATPAGCGNLAVTVENLSTGDVNYFWQFNDPANPIAWSIAENPVYSYVGYGEFGITLVVEPGTACADTFSTTVVISPPLASDLTFEACQGDSVTFGGLELPAGSVTDFTLTASNGCDSVVTVTVETLPTFTSQIELAACQGATVEFHGVTLVPNQTEVFIFSNPSGCDSVITVHVAELPPAEFSYQVESACPNLSNGRLTATGISGGTPPLLFSLDGSLPQPETVFENVAAGSHTLTLLDANGCFFEKSMVVPVVPPMTVQATGETLPCLDSVLLTPVVTSALPVEWQWTDSSGSVISTLPELWVNIPGVYSFLVKNACETAGRSIAVTSEVESSGISFYAPNTFSPNGDGINDCFRVYPSTGMEVLEFQLLIFDRWGNLLFETVNIDGCWDGFFKGRPLDASVCVWFFTAKAVDCHGQVEEIFREGGVTVMR